MDKKMMHKKSMKKKKRKKIKVLVTCNTITHFEHNIIIYIYIFLSFVVSSKAMFVNMIQENCSIIKFNEKNILTKSQSNFYD